MTLFQVSSMQSEIKDLDTLVLKHFYSQKLGALDLTLELILHTLHSKASV